MPVPNIRLELSAAEKDIESQPMLAKNGPPAQKVRSRSPRSPAPVVSANALNLLLAVFSGRKEGGWEFVVSKLLALAAACHLPKVAQADTRDTARLVRIALQCTSTATVRVLKPYY